jgi:transcriptional regulator with XRE-family HTH domain
MKFGQLAKNLRIERKMTLRHFCSELGIDPSNWSKIERGVSSAPKDQAIIIKWADFFNLTGDSRQEFLDLADLSRSEIPQDVASDERVLAAMPAFFRAMRGNDLEGEKLKDFFESIRAINSPDKSALG